MDKGTDEVAGVRIIVWVRYKWSRCVVYVVPVNLLKQWVLSQSWTQPNAHNISRQVLVNSHLVGWAVCWRLNRSKSQVSTRTGNFC